MVRFGPAGNSESFYEQGYQHTIEQPAWLNQLGLNAYEYSFGRGVRIKDDTAEKLGEEFKKYSILPSCHAPYYINFATMEQEKSENNYRYLLQSAHAARCMGAQRVIFHPGVAGEDRKASVERIKERLKKAVLVLEDAGLGDITLCPETMGKINQVGDLQETLEFCTVSDKLMPCIDFGHLYARSLGADEGEEATCRILDAIVAALGEERGKQFHVHFSNIEYTKAGEKRHHNYGDSEYGPSFEPLAKQIVLRNLDLTIICESKGRMAEDAALFMSMWNKEKNR